MKTKRSAVIVALLLAGIGVAAVAWWVRPVAPRSQEVPVRSRLASAGGGTDGAVAVDFTLRSASGPMRLSDYRGRVVLVYFGYTFCPDICPTSLSATARALNSLRPEELRALQVLFVSVDPARDSVERLGEYAAFFHPSILGVTGTEVEVAEAARLFGAVYARHDSPGGGAYSIDHTALTYVVSPDGRLVARLPHAAEAALVATEVRRWLQPAASPQGVP
jgi:protein SCO1/2